MQIDWENMTLSEAQDLADSLTSAFNFIVKCPGSDKLLDVSYLTVAGRYDDNFHANEST